MSVRASRSHALALAATIVSACFISQATFIALGDAPAIADTPSPQATSSSTAYSWATDPLRAPGVLWHRTAASVPAPPAPPSRAWLLLDSDSGDVLAASNARVPLPPASTLKTLTAITLMPRLDPNFIYKATDKDAGIEGSGAGLVVGGTYSVRQLFIGMMLPSGNDAAMALTHVYNHNGNRALSLMNATARRLGAIQTVAKSPNGLPRPGQVTTVADMALFGNAAIHLPMFRQIAHLKTYDFPGRMPKPGRTRATYQIQNENPLIKHNVNGTLGGKTGYTRQALRTYWGAVKRGDRTLIVVVYGFVGTTYNYARNLLWWGFNNATNLRPVGHLPTELGNHWAADAVPKTPAAPSATAPVAAAPSVRAPASSPAATTARTGTLVILLLLPTVILARRALRYRRSRA